MKLTGRNLTYNLSGKDVAALQAALKRLGYELPVEETDAKRFGDETQKAVMSVQRDAALTPDGIVERRTVLAINRALATVVQADKGQFSVRGTVRHPDGRPFAGRVVVYDRDLRKSEKLGEAELGTAGDAWRQRIGLAMSPLEHADYDPVLEALRLQLDAPVFDAAWADGAAMSLEQAIQNTLETSARSSSGV